jgi:isoquinoline 1-oxidoreductase beta subunit
MIKNITRREFLRLSGLTIAISLTPSGYRILSAGEVAKDKSFSPNVWLRVTPDNIVTIVVNKSEMGQGVYTSLPMIVADELDADWKQVKIKAAPAGSQYIDPVWGMEATGGSTSVRHMFEPLRKAGAAAREMLITAAAKKWGVPVGECKPSKGTIIHNKSNRKLTYGQLAEDASTLPVPENPSLKKESQFTIIGKPLDRLDIPGKVNGSAIFGIDVFVPNMLYASIERPPVFGAKALSYNKEAALKIAGVEHVMDVESLSYGYRGKAVCAVTLEGAWKGKDALNVKWDKGSDPELNNKSLQKILIEHLKKDGIVARNDGDVKLALNKASKRVEATYVLPYLYHATMEPMNCTAHVTPDKCEIWVPTQNQTGVLNVAEKITGLKPDQISVHTTYLGGGYGRRFETDVVQEALLISKETGRPVKLIWTREEDVKNDVYRPANSCRIEGGIDENGRTIAWSHKVVCPSIFSRAMPQGMQGDIDPAAVEGIANMEYEIPNVHVEYIRLDLPVPVGFWRSVGNSENAFTVECFVDELAHAAKRDPLEFRLNLLKNHKRPYKVLEVAAEKAGWKKPPKKGQGRGIAQHFSFGSYIAQVAEVSVNEKSGDVKVHRVVCAVDCGDVINPAIIAAQIEGGILMGLSAALKEAVELERGGVASSNFNNYQLLRMYEAPPEVEVHIVRSREKPGGIGEPGVPPIAPAVANAVFNAKGIRLRKLPMTPETVKEAAIKV